MAELPPAFLSEPVTGRRISRETQAEERLALALDRMTMVFAKRGYQAATVNDLLSGAKMGMGAFYEDFDGKEDCFIRVYERVLGRVRGRVLAAAGDNEEWARRILLGLGAVIEFVSEDPLAAKIVLMEAQTGGAAALERHRELLSEVVSFLALGRREGSPGKRLPEGFEESATSGLFWLLQTKVVRGELGEPAKLQREMSKVVLEPFLGPAKAKRIIENTR